MFTFFTALSPLYRVLAIAAVILGIFTFGYYKGYSNEKEKFDAFKAELAATVATQEAKNKQITKGSERISKETSDAYLNNLDNVKSYYQRVYHVGTSSVPTVPKGSSGANEGTPNKLPGQCAETTLQLIYLQKWVKQQESNYNESD